jgi:hypothetical protein
MPELFRDNTIALNPAALPEPEYSYCKTKNPFYGSNIDMPSKEVIQFINYINPKLNQNRYDDQTIINNLLNRFKSQGFMNFGEQPVVVQQQDPNEFIIQLLNYAEHLFNINELRYCEQDTLYTVVNGICANPQPSYTNSSSILSLPITGTKASILDLIANYEGMEKTSDTQCKRIKIDNTSKFIVIQLKLYDNLLRKQRQPIQFDNANNTITINGINYNLKSVIFHQGATMNSGHYIAAVRINTQWTLFNDNLPLQTLANINDVDQNTYSPYMFLYERVTPGNMTGGASGFGSILSTTIHYTF